MKQKVIHICIISTQLSCLLQASQNNPLFVSEMITEETSSSSFSGSPGKILFDSLYNEEDLRAMLTSSNDDVTIYSKGIHNLKHNFLESLIKQIKTEHENHLSLLSLTEHENHLSLLSLEKNRQELHNILLSIINTTEVDISDTYIINQRYRRITEKYKKEVLAHHVIMIEAITPEEGRPSLSKADITREKEEYLANVIESLKKIINTQIQEFHAIAANHMVKKKQPAYLSKVKDREELDRFFYDY